MALVPTNQLFPNQTPQYWTPPVQLPLQQGVSWESIFWTAGAFTLAAVIGKMFESPVRRCGTCGRVGHDTRRCSQNSAKRVPLRMAKTGHCSCCKRRVRRTEAHHYAGPADGSKGREMCGTCHLVCGHGGSWQNMAVNPRYCRL